MRACRAGTQSCIFRGPFFWVTLNETFGASVSPSVTLEGHGRQNEMPEQAPLWRVTVGNRGAWETGLPAALNDPTLKVTFFP